MTISVVIPTYNSAVNLRLCLQSVIWSNEVIIVDMGSKDETIQIARAFGAKIFRRIPNDGNFDSNRKFGMQKTRTDWILKLDSDEVLSPELQKEIKRLLTRPSVKEVGFNLYNHIYMFGQRVKYGPVKIGSHELRLFRNGFWKYNPYRYHQQVTVDGPSGYLKGFYYHYNHSSISSFIRKTNIYTTLDSQFYSKRIHFLELVIAPLKTFFKLYLVQLGFLDRELGFVTCSLYSMYNLIEKIKVWERQNI